MAVPVYVGDRVLVNVVVTGTVSYEIASAISGYLTPENAGIVTGSLVAYVVVDSLENPTVFEVGEGIYTNAATDTISRNTIIATHLGATGVPSAYSWPSGGSKYLFLAPSAKRFVMYDSDGGMTLNTHLTLVSGEVASVSVSTPGDRNTGLFFPGADKVALAAGGVKVFEVTPTSVNIAAAVTITSSLTVGPSLTVASTITVNGGGPVLDKTGITSVAALNSGPLAGFRNAIINGDFDIWQRGTSFSNPAFGDFGADRWFVIYDGSGATRTISRQTFTVGQTDVPDEPRYFYRFNQSVAGTGGTYNVIRQRIEGVRTFAGKTVSVSFYAKGGSNLTLPTIALFQYFGSGGSPSADVSTTIATNQSVTTSWTKFTYSVTVPSISGKTLGTDNNDDLSFLIYVPVNALFTFDLSHIQIEVGATATPFERRPLSTELALCQRYYWKTFDQGTAPAQNAGVTGALGFGVLLTSGNATYVGASFPVAMRIAPTMTSFNPSAANAQARNVTNNADFSSTTLVSTQWGFYFTATAGAWATGSLSRLHATASAEL